MSLRYLTGGESHGPALTVILDGIPAGLPMGEEYLNIDLKRRQQGSGAGDRMSIEQDEARILGGVMAGLTTGAPLVISIENRDYARWSGQEIAPFTRPRPGHADLTGVVKFGLPDLRPALERASARETAARVAAGAVCRGLLAQFDIQVGGYVCSIGEVEADLVEISAQERIIRARDSMVACPDRAAAGGMQERIQQASQAGDSLGGVIEVVALGVPPGLGSYTQGDRRLEARLGSELLGIQAIKGVEFGPAFENARLPGSYAQDVIRLSGDELVRCGNRCGGLEGGITTGQPLVVRAAMKPIATTRMPRQTVDLASGQEVPTKYERSDVCPVPRAVVILEAAVALVLADALLEKLGGDSLSEMRPRFETLRKMRLSDLPVDNCTHIFWGKHA